MDPGHRWFQHYLLKKNNYIKLCSILTFFGVESILCYYFELKKNAKNVSSKKQIVEQFYLIFF